MTGLRALALLGLCALACAKRPAAEASAPPGTAAPEPEAAADEDAAKELEAKDAPAAAGTSPAQFSATASLDDLTAALDEYEAELRAEGVRLKTYRKEKDKQTPHGKRTTVPTTKPADAVATKKDDPRVRICAFRTSVCEIKSKICVLAEEHEDEPRYAAACKRATNDCKRATEACDDA